VSDALDELLADLTEEQREALRTAARHDCWRRGYLAYKFQDDPGQLDTWRRIESETHQTRWVLEWSRKRGKSYFLVCVAAMLCQRYRLKRVVFGAPTFKHLEEFILPLLDEVAADCPEDIRPRYEPSTGHWFFPATGSWVHFFGADDKRKANRGRGPAAIAAIFDECGFTPVLNYVLSSIFRPSMLHGGLFTILGSTPAEEPDHDFTRICEVAEANGTLIHQTIHDNPRLTPERIAQFIEEDARDNGMTASEYQASTVFRREYLAERVTEKTLMVMGGDWELMREASLVPHERPQFFDAYECMDFGGTDPRAVLFGFYDFKQGCLVIEDEVNLRNNESTAELAAAIQQKERELYGAKSWDGTLRAVREESLGDLLHFLKPEERARVAAAHEAPLQPYLRVCDHDIQTAIDLHRQHHLTAVPAEKVELRHVVNDFRVALRQGRVKVNPRCKDLDRQLRTGEWTSPRATDWKRKNGEHADLLWCAIYLWRSVRQQRNPWPPNWGIDPDNVVRRAPPANPLRALAGGRRR
jgi:hypothetical protein